jgi:hypothetical protein
MHIITRVLAGIVLASFAVNFVHLGVRYIPPGETFWYKPSTGIPRAGYIIGIVAFLTFNILSLYGLVPDYKAMGVAWGCLITENVYSIYRRHVQRRNSPHDAKVT